jgi:hypothetical protein
MKKLFTYCAALILLGLILVSCDKPAPTELISDTNSETNYELLNDPSSENYLTTGMDTSGITQDFSNLVNLISISGIKITANGSTNNFSLAQAFFFDKNKPIKNSAGNIIAYETITPAPGLVYFDGIRARLVDHKIRYHDRGVPMETNIGKKYLLWSGIIDPYTFPYSSATNFKLTLWTGDSVMFPIQTPVEINGSVQVSGHKNSKDLKALVQWNAENANRVIIVISLIKHGQLFSIPIYKIRTADDGVFRVPAKLLNDLRLDEFAKIIFTLIRSKEKHDGKANNLLFLSAQSIHSIVLDIP